MTGTPLQNELNELFCLLAFLEEVRAEDIARLIDATPDPAALALATTAPEQGIRTAKKALKKSGKNP